LGIAVALPLRELLGRIAMGKRKYVSTVIAATLLSLGCSVESDDAEESPTQFLSNTVGGLGGNYPDMTTYVADYRNPMAALEITRLVATQRFVSGAGHKFYTYLMTDPSAPTQPIPTTDPIVKQIPFDVSGVTDNAYWFAAPAKGFFGNVGADVQFDPVDGHPTFNQWTDIHSGATGLPHDSTNFGCKPVPAGQPIGNATCYIDSGGEERQSVYTVFTDSDSKWFVVKGGLLLIRQSGEVDIDFLVDSSQTKGSGADGDCQCPALTFKSYSIDWAIRAPARFNTVTGNYLRYPTVGGKMNENGGTTALVLIQQINPATQLPNSD
jgi:hypothetical protein